MNKHFLPWLAATLCIISSIFTALIVYYLFYYLCVERICCCRPSMPNISYIQNSKSSKSLHNINSENPTSPDSDKSCDQSSSSDNNVMKHTDLNMSYSKKKKRKIVDINPYFRYSTLIAAVLYSILAFLNITDLIIICVVFYDLNDLNIQHHKSIKNIWVVARVIGPLARVAMLALLNGRLYYTFVGSAYAISKWIFYTLNTIVVIIVLLCFLTIIVPVEKANQITVGILAFTIIDMVILLNLYNRKLLRLIVTK
eukprot:199871_1